jgi:hypothetical protein
MMSQLLTVVPIKASMLAMTPVHLYAVRKEDLKNHFK